MWKWLSVIRYISLMTLEEEEVAGGGIFVTYPVVGKEKAVTHVKAHVRNEGKRKRKAQLRTQLIDKSGKNSGLSIDSFSVVSR